MKKIYSELLMYVAVVIACFVILIWAIRLLELDLSVPFGYAGGDGIGAISAIKAVIDNGWYYENPYLGMPNGQNFYDFPVVDATTFILTKFLALFFSDYAVVVNLLYLLGFFLTTLTSFAVFRHFKISFLIALVGSLLYAFLPYHYSRGLGHFFLGLYYLIPPAIMVVLWIFSRKDLLFSYDSLQAKTFFNPKSPTFWIAALICLLVSGSGIYYAFFTCFFLAVAGFSALLLRKQYNLLNALILIGIIATGVMVQTLPNLAYQTKYGNNMVKRNDADAEVHGLKMTFLVLPTIYHRIPQLAQFTGNYNATAPLCYENNQAALGIIGSIGFLFLLGWMLFYRHLAVAEPIEHLSVLNLAAVLLATIGGFASLFTYLTHFPIRGYNRISIFIAFFSLLLVMLLLEKWRTKWATTSYKLVIFNLFIGIILVLGILDQWPSSNIPGASINSNQYFQDKQFIQRIEAQLPLNTMIFQLPYFPFPEHLFVNKIGGYEPVKGYLHSTHLRWSYGAPKGREVAIWQERVSSMLPHPFLNEITKAGFGGLWIDRFGYTDNGVSIIDQFNKVLKAQPIESIDKRYAFWNISKIKSQEFFDTSCFNTKKAIEVNSATANCGYVLTNGWSYLKDGWSTANSEMEIDLPKDCQSLICDLKLSLSRVYNASIAKPIKVSAKINRIIVGEWSFVVDGPQTISIPLDTQTLHGQTTGIKIQFSIPMLSRLRKYLEYLMMVGFLVLV